MAGADIAAAIIALAKAELGVPYVMGGSSPSGFDCSGLVQWVYQKQGIALPRTTFDQINQGIQVSEKNAAVGDLVFFNETGSDAPGPGGSPWGHVGIYLGNGMMLDAPNPSATVRIESIKGFSPVNQYTFRRVIPNYAGTGDTGVTTPGLSSLLTGQDSTSSNGWTGASIAASLGLSDSLFNSIPELKGVLNAATSEGLDPSTAQGQASFTAMLQSTNWYKQHSDASRKWELLVRADPGEANRQRQQALANVAHTAASMGVTLTANQEFVLAAQALQTGLSDDELKFSIAAHLQVNKTGQYGGDAGKLADSIRQTAQNYGMGTSALGVGKMVYNILNGKLSEQDFTNQAKTYAKGMFPGISAAIDSGQTVRDAVAPYLQVYQSTLEQDSNAVDLTKDQSLRQALSYKATGSDGKPAAGAPTTMPLWQYEQSLKQDPRWLATDNAQTSIVGAGTKVLKDLGLSA